MSRIRFLARKPLPIFNVAQGAIAIGTNPAATFSSDGNDTRGSPIIIPFGDSVEPQTWFIVPVPGPDSTTNDDPYFVIQHAGSSMWAYVPPAPNVNDAVLATPTTATIWRIRHIANQGHLIYPAANPALFLGLLSKEVGAQVTLQTNTSSNDSVVKPDILWRFDTETSKTTLPPA